MHAGDLALSHMAHDFWHEATHVDGRLWRSFAALLTRPGQLTKDYWDGRRGVWMRPLRIFLIVTALSLVLAPDAAGPLGMRVFASQGKGGPKLMVGTRPSGGGGGAEASFGLDRPLDAAGLAHLNEKIHKIYKVIQYVSLAVFAALSMLLSRNAQPYFGAHLIFALHYYSFEYLLTGAVSKLPVNPSISLALGFWYLAFAVWRTVGAGRFSTRRIGLDWRSFWRAVVLSMAVAVTELLIMSAASAIALRPQ